MKEKIDRNDFIEQSREQTLQSYLEQQIFLLKHIVIGLKKKEFGTVQLLKDMDTTNLRMCTSIVNQEKSMVSSSQGGSRTKERARDIKRYMVSMREEQLGMVSSYCFPQRGIVLVIGERDDSIAEWGKEQGICLQMLDKKSDEEQIIKLMEQDIAGVLGVASKSYTEDEALDFLRTLFFAAKYLSENMKKQDRKVFFGGITFLGGRFGWDSSVSTFVHGSISGLYKTVSLEWQGKAVVRYIDTDLETSYKDALNALKDELQYGNYVEVGRRKQDSRVIVTLTENYDELSAETQPTPDEVFMVSGGARGITTECILKLAKKYHCNFLLLGRTKLLPEESCYKDAISIQEIKNIIFQQCKERKESIQPKELERKAGAIIAQREIIKNIQLLESYGSQVIYYTCDIRNKNELKLAIKQCEEKLGKITGIIHGAGVLADKLIEKKTRQDFENVFGIKYEGLNNMLSLVNQDVIKYMIFFSSIAGFFGNIGQSDYSIANEYLNQFARYWKKTHPQCITMSINWGPWDGGMVNMALRKAMKEAGIKLIPIEVGTQYFMEIFDKKHNEDMCQIIINYSNEWGG